MSTKITDALARRVHLMRFATALTARGAEFHLTRPAHRPWRVHIHLGGGAAVELLCAGAEGVFAIVSNDGRILGPVGDPATVDVALHLRRRPASLSA
jgi:hypothetical protein